MAFSRGLIPGTPQLKGQLGAFEWSFFAGHGRLLAFVLAGLLIALAFAMTWIEGHVNRFWERIKDGLAILRTPERYLRGVVSLQALGWACRVGGMYFFLEAFHVPAGLPDAALALSAGSVATLMPLTPGGAGPQQALLLYMFSGEASRSAVLSFSVGMQFAVTITTQRWAPLHHPDAAPAALEGARVASVAARPATRACTPETMISLHAR